MTFDGFEGQALIETNGATDMLAAAIGMAEDSPTLDAALARVARTPVAAETSPATDGPSGSGTTIQRLLMRAAFQVLDGGGSEPVIWTEPIGGDDGEGQEVVVDGIRPREPGGSGGLTSGTGGGGGQEGGGGEGSGDGGGESSDLYDHCLSAEEFNQLSPEQQEDYLVAVEAAEIAREIALMPDRDFIEYGSIIYRDANGVITHTPIAGGNATSVTGPMAGGVARLGKRAEHGPLAPSDSL